MANDPKYVRLATRLQRGSVTDVMGSGWGISGLDVRKFPEDSVAARFVRGKLNAGLLEPASKSEWEEVHDTSVEDYARDNILGFGENHQEGAFQRIAAEATARLEANLAAADDGDSDDSDSEGEEEDEAPKAKSSKGKKSKSSK